MFGGDESNEEKWGIEGRWGILGVGARHFNKVGRLSLA